MNDMSGFRELTTALSCPKFSFVLLPQFSLLALSGAIEPLRHANNALGADRFTWTIFSETGLEVESSSGIPVRPAGRVDEVPSDSNVILVGGANITSFSSSYMRSWIRRVATRVPLLGGLCTATHVLAEAGVLDGYSATVHWELAQSLKEKFPRIIISDGLFELDRNRLTCAGEAASTDLMLYVLGNLHGRIVASTVAAQVLHGRPRLPVEPQAPLTIRAGTRNRYLLGALALMESHIEEPISVDQIAKRSGCSRRQLERVFRSKTGKSPVLYYRSLRLDRARQLLFETQLSVTEIAAATGFISGSALSATYKRRFGRTPAREDNQRTSPLPDVNPPRFGDLSTEDLQPLK